MLAFQREIVVTIVMDTREGTKKCKNQRDRRRTTKNNPQIKTGQNKEREPTGEKRFGQQNIWLHSLWDYPAQSKITLKGVLVCNNVTSRGTHKALICDVGVRPPFATNKWIRKVIENLSYWILYLNVVQQLKKKSQYIQF